MISRSQKYHCLHCSCQSPLFRFLEVPELELVNAHRYEIAYKCGETIFKQGSPAAHVLSFTGGLAKISFETSDRHLIIGLIRPGDFIAGPGTHLSYSHSYSVTAIAPSNVCAIETSVFFKLLRQNQRFMEHYLKEVNSAYMNLVFRLANQTNKQVRGKLADALLYLAVNIFNSNRFPLTLTTRELAELAGVSKESCVRTLKEFCDDKIMQICNREIIILETSQLQQISKVG